MSRNFFRTGRLALHMLRLDRFRLPVWLISLTVITPLIAVSLHELYPTAADRQVLAGAMLNPAMVALVGPGYGLEQYTFGAMLANQMLVITALIIGVMSILLTVRHTRTDEEEGRVELIRSLPVGRLSNLSAVFGVMSAVYLLLTIFTACGLYVLKIESINFEGALLYGAILGTTGILFTALTTVFAQLSQSSRGTLGLSFGVLLFSYMLRAVGDVNNETVSLLSPLGWVHRTEVFVNNIWWPVMLMLGFSILLTILAFYFNAKRDLNSGLLPSRPGRKQASPFLSSPLGLAFRLQRTGQIAWMIALLLIGSTYGAILGDLDSFIAEIELMQQMLSPTEGSTLVEQYIALLMSVLAIGCTIPVLILLLKVNREEKQGRMEYLFSQAVSRSRVLGSYCFLSLIGSIVMLSLAAFGLGGAASVVVEEGPKLGSILQAAYAYLPAIWIMLGFAMFLIGFFPNRTGLAWLYLVYCFLTVYLGGLFQFPEWVLQLSPYQHIPSLPMEEGNSLRLALLSFVALVLTVLGFIGYNRRDIHT